MTYGGAHADVATPSCVHSMSVGELLNPSEETIFMEDPTDEDYCRVDTNSENEIRSELSSADATEVDDEDAAGSTQTPGNLYAEMLRMKLMAQLFVGADVMGISSREDIGLRSKCSDNFGRS
ncbi:hypothetical protein Pcac1_g15764 [Phytophthora cactorum]|nr:hypothetical protein Pcac1_g15764 [Phytophthora cactorum]